jgi:hypothetical protein
MPEPNEQVLRRIRDHAFLSMPVPKRQTTNLFLDRRVYEKGEVLGPKIQKITVKQPSLLVFADDQPLANFAHPCRYLLYDPEKGSLRARSRQDFRRFRTSRLRRSTFFMSPFVFSRIQTSTM